MEEKKKYARGKHPNSRKGDKNLKPVNTLPKEQQREIRSMGGKASQATQKQNLIIKNILEKAVAALVKDDATGEELTISQICGTRSVTYASYYENYAFHLVFNIFLFIIFRLCFRHKIL